MTKFTAALREISIYKAGLQSQVGVIFFYV